MVLCFDRPIGVAVLPPWENMIGKIRSAMRSMVAVVPTTAVEVPDLLSADVQRTEVQRHELQRSELQCASAQLYATAAGLPYQEAQVTVAPGNIGIGGKQYAANLLPHQSPYGELQLQVEGATWTALVTPLGVGYLITPDGVIVPKTKIVAKDFYKAMCL